MSVFGLWRGSPTVGPSSSSVRLHIYVSSHTLYITEISLNMTVSNQSTQHVLDHRYIWFAGLIFSTLQGNVSRDQLLQKVSDMTSIPEATLWGPACNKAVRELFPESNAQRKGKYKKYPLLCYSWFKLCEVN